MKKLFLILLFLGLVILIGYLLFANSNDKRGDESQIYVDFNPNFENEQTTNEPTPDITTILRSDTSPALDTVINNIYRDNYYVLECSNESVDSNAIIMTALYDGSVAKEGYEKAYQSIKNWEKNAVAELGHVIYPSLSRQTARVDFVWFEPYVVNNEHIIAKDFHKTLFYIDDRAYEMHYGWTLNYVIFAPSQNCLEEVMVSMYHVH